MRELNLSPLRKAAAWAWLGLAVVSCCPAAPAPTPARSGWFLDAARYRSSVHGRLTCDRCHSEIAEQGKPAGKDPHGRGTDLRSQPPAFQDCRNCHPRPFDLFQEGPHGAALEEIATGLPDCSSCHSAHDGEKIRTRQEAVALQLTKCGSCHEPAAQDFAAGQHPTPGHASARELGCGVCHDVHAARPLTADPAAHPACQNCHAHNPELQEGRE